MKEKKKPGRFTMQFNLEDPQQRKASELLEQQGRHKAQFVTSAVLHYVQHPDVQGHSCGPSAVDEAMLERVLLTLLGKYPQFAGAALDRPSEADRSPSLAASADVPWENAISGDALEAITNTLAAFQV